MIDEKKLIEYLETLVEFERKKSQESAQIGAFDMATCYGHGEYCYKNAINAAEEQPKIGGWIACKERLPDTRNNVLICQNDGYISIGYYSQEKFLDLNSYPFSEVIAWQSLPEAYHG